MNKLFIVIGLVFAVSCHSGNKMNDKVNEQEYELVLVEDTINVSGMHCDMCVQSIEKGVNELEGISSVKASLQDSTTIVKFDASKTDLAQIEKAIEKRGYNVKRNL